MFPKNILVQHGDFHPMGSQSEIKTPENGHFNSTNFRDFQTLPNCWWDLNCLEKCVLVRCVGANLPQGSGKTKECFMFQTTTWLLLCKLYQIVHCIDLHSVLECKYSSNLFSHPNLLPWNEGGLRLTGHAKWAPTSFR